MSLRTQEGDQIINLQDLMMRQIQLRNTPMLHFELDKQFKKTLETLEVLRQVSRELQQKDQQRQASAEPGTAAPGTAGPAEGGDGSAPDEPREVEEPVDSDEPGDSREPGDLGEPADES